MWRQWLSLRFSGKRCPPDSAHQAIVLDAADAVRVIGAGLVRELLPMATCIDVMADAMRAASASEVVIPPRLHMPLADGSAVLLVMPGSSVRPPYYGAKIIGMHDANPAHGLAAIQGFLVLFEHATGAPAALIDASTITAIRTAAASALATRELARLDARTLGVLGTGVQARTHVEAISRVRCLEEIRIWGRNRDKAVRVAAETEQPDGPRVVAVDDPAEAASCDIVACVTGATEPVLSNEWLQPGTHINLVGSHTATKREADSATMARARIYVDLRAAALQEAGDILIPLGEGVIDKSSIVGEIGELLAGHVSGRATASDITLYKSLGVVAQDLFAAASVLAAANEQEVGMQVSLD